MMKKSIFIVFALAAFMAVGCKDDSPAEPLEKSPNVSRGSDIKPTAWIAPDPSLYEITMSIQVELGNKLANYQSEEDLMRAVINGETRAVAEPRTQYGVTHFPLTIFGSAAEKSVSLQYYCDRLHRIYTITDWATLDSSAPPTGEDGIYRPKFVN